MASAIESLNAQMLRDERFTVHPDREGGTKKIATYLNRNGDAIALDLSSGSVMGIWVSSHLVTQRVLSAIRRVLYIQGEGRNSNINVPELKSRVLTRFEPSSLSQAREVIDYFAAI